MHTDDIMRGERWTDCEDAYLIDAIVAGHSRADAAFALRRTERGIQQRWRRLRCATGALPGAPHCWWTPDEDALLRQCVKEQVSVRLMREVLPGRTTRAILHRMQRLRITWQRQDQWTAAEVDTLRQQARHLTAEAIAKQLGRTRSAVCGKAKRIGVTLRKGARR